MGRSHFHPSRCKICGISSAETKISVQGMCRTHGDERRDANLEQLMAHDGEWFDHWARRNYMAARRALVQAQRSAGLDVSAEQAV